MKKVVVMPFSDYEKMSNKNNNTQPLQQNQPLPAVLHEPKINQLADVEKDLTEILNSRMNIYEKRLKYQEILQKLLDLKEKYTSVNEPTPTNETIKNEKDFKTILENSLPQTVKNKGIALYNTLKDQLIWDDDGQIIIDGVPIKGSNIVDLISDLTRNWLRNPVTGWPVIKQKLRVINFPKSLISNQNRLMDLEDVFSLPRDIASGSSGEITAPTTPLGLTNKRRHKNPYPSAKKLRKKADITRKWLKI